MSSAPLSPGRDAGEPIVIFAMRGSQYVMKVMACADARNIPYQVRCARGICVAWQG